MKQYYECHLTMKGDPNKISQAVKRLGWKYSAIDDDIDLGKGVKCYATKQFNKRKLLDDIIVDLKATAIILGVHTNSKILRKKIELVIFDERSK